MPDLEKEFQSTSEMSPTTASSTLSWFALRVRSRSENLVGTVLETKGYESYSPSYISQRKYSDRIKRVETAIFPGYVFCRLSACDVLSVLSTPAVQCVVGIGPNPQPIADDEIERLQRSIRHGESVAPCPPVRIGQRVRVQSGVLAGVEGFLVDIRNTQRLVINADLLNRAISLEIDADNVLSV